MHYSKYVLAFFRMMLVTTFLSLLACSGKGLKELETKDTAVANFELEYQAAIELVEGEKYKEAAEKFEALSQKHPGYPGPYVNAGIAWYHLGELDQAREAFKQVLSLPKKQDNKEQGKEQESKEKESREKEKFEDGQSFQPFMLVSQNYLGLIAREAGEFVLAEKHYREALVIDAEHAPTIRNLAILLDLYQGKIADAVILYEKYQSLLEEPDAQVKDWIFDINARLERERN